MKEQSTTSWFTWFMASGYGRLARVALGVAVIALGLGVLSLPLGFAVAALGLVPVAAGVFNLCPIAPAWGGHLLGSRYCQAGRPHR